MAAKDDHPIADLLRLRGIGVEEDLRAIDVRLELDPVNVFRTELAPGVADAQQVFAIFACFEHKNRIETILDLFAIVMADEVMLRPERVVHIPGLLVGVSFGRLDPNARVQLGIECFSVSPDTIALAFPGAKAIPIHLAFGLDLPVDRDRQLLGDFVAVGLEVIRKRCDVNPVRCRRALGPDVLIGSFVGAGIRHQIDFRHFTGSQQAQLDPLARLAAQRVNQSGP